MAFFYNAADRASAILAALTAIDPLTLQNDRDRAARTYVMAVLATLPLNMGIVVHAVNDDADQMTVTIRHLAFGTYAT